MDLNFHDITIPINVDTLRLTTASEWSYRWNDVVITVPVDRLLRLVEPLGTIDNVAMLPLSVIFDGNM
jgi:hypothetical protein